MKNEEINLAIAKDLGWRGFFREWKVLWGKSPTTGETPIPVPIYTDDLNAMHRAVMSKSPAFRKAMRFWLYELTDQMSAHDATAKQRADAFLKTAEQIKESAK